MFYNCVMALRVGEKDEGTDRDTFQLTGWIVAITTATIMVVALLTEPSLAWFVLPALMVGVLLAIILQSPRLAFRAEKDQERPEIQIAKIPVKGSMGLVFTIGTMAIFFLALPEIRWFLLLALPAGALTGLGLHLWHNRHP